MLRRMLKGAILRKSQIRQHAPLKQRHLLPLLPIEELVQMCLRSILYIQTRNVAYIRSFFTILLVKLDALMRHGQRKNAVCGTVSTETITIVNALLVVKNARKRQPKGATSTKSKIFG